MKNKKNKKRTKILTPPALNLKQRLQRDLSAAESVLRQGVVTPQGMVLVSSVTSLNMLLASFAYEVSRLEVE